MSWSCYQTPFASTIPCRLFCRAREEPCLWKREVLWSCIAANRLSTFATSIFPHLPIDYQVLIQGLLILRITQSRCRYQLSSFLFYTTKLHLLPLCKPAAHIEIFWTGFRVPSQVLQIISIQSSFLVHISQMKSLSTISFLPILLIDHDKDDQKYRPPDIV